MDGLPADVAHDELRNLLRLVLVQGVGPRLRRALLERFGTVEEVFAATKSALLEVPGIGPKVADKLRAAGELDVDQQFELCRRHGVNLIDAERPQFPENLREIHDPPALLFVRGQLLPQDALAIAIVGSRHATHYGKTQAARLGASLARAGLTIVSGLARGIDAAAHRGALEAGGRTIAVLGGGLSKIYPPEHAELAHEVAEQGALITELPMQASPVAGNFPQRNRIISGISLGVLVVEAAARSGALSTAQHALEQNREVFAVPGPVDSRMSRGCHQLIRDGAKLVESAEDVLEELGPLAGAVTTETGEQVHRPAELLLNDQESRILNAVQTSPTPVDQVIVTSGLPPGQVLATLSVLEMRRLVKRQGGNLVFRP